MKQWHWWLVLAIGVVHLVSDGQATIGAAKKLGLL